MGLFTTRMIDETRTRVNYGPERLPGGPSWGYAAGFLTRTAAADMLAGLRAVQMFHPKTWYVQLKSIERIP